MEKQSFLPIKFYHKNETQDYYKIKNYEGVVFPKYDFTGFPEFQLVLPDNPDTWVVGDFVVTLVELATGTEWNVAVYKRPELDYLLYDAGDFWVFVLEYFPFASAPPNFNYGKYYYRVFHDGGETWYSEIFEICDLETNIILSEFIEISGFASFSSTFVTGAGDNYIYTQFCKTANPVASAGIELDYNFDEDVDIYIVTGNHTGAPACGSTDWNDNVSISIFNGATAVSTPTITLSATDTLYRFTIKAPLERPAGVPFIMQIAINDLTKGVFWMWAQRKFAAKHILIDYANERNFCKIVYEDNFRVKFFLDAKQVLDNNQIEENVTEDDEANKNRIIGTDQKWNSIQFVGGEYLLNAMSLLRLHDDITIVTETGEPMDVVELLMEQSPFDFEAVTIKLVYREDSCSWTFCEFDVV